ncbi:MAG: alpha/beta hydrolase [Gammaproteobacteria bacterium]|nr:alpha/beta hydrolase [Gammaproteobacteria bacterium]
MATFVLLHGAWHGGWSWRFVGEILEQHNHQVFTPTMIGLAEREHLNTEDVSINALVDDIAQFVISENLKDVILVGHSFGGAVISAVAEHISDRIKQLVYLDAAVLGDGESMFDRIPLEIAAERQRLMKESDDGFSLPIPTAEDLGIFENEQWEYVKQFLTPQPLSSYTTNLTLKYTPGEGFPCCYIHCAKPSYSTLAWARERAKSYGWPIIPIETGHDAMISAPEMLSEILIESISLDRNSFPDSNKNNHKRIFAEV